MKRDRIVIIPYIREGNENEVNKLHILEENFTVYGEMSSSIDLCGILRTKAIFLGWTEQTLDRKMKCLILLYKLMGVKIFWYYHNKLPHESTLGDKSAESIKWLADHSTKILLHSKASIEYIPNASRNAKKSVYIPMVKYSHVADEELVTKIRNQYGLDHATFVFTMFGSIRPYKNIEAIIRAFTEINLYGAKLIIAGYAQNVEYYERLKKMSSISENIIIDNTNMSFIKLDSIISASDVIVAYYNEKSALNSGAMIHAFSCGKPVISADICTARDYSQYDFVYCCKGELKNEMKRAYDIGKEKNAIIGQRAMRMMERDNNYNHVANIMYNLIEGKNF